MKKLYGIAGVGLLAVSGYGALFQLHDGTLPLLRTAGFEVGYRLDNGDIRHFPPGWQGIYEGTTGASSAEATFAGRPAWLLLHPWKIHPEAEIFLGYQVKLPEAKKLELKFAVAMDPQSTTPRADGSTPGDGVRFEAEVDGTRVFSYFGNDAEPRDFSVDLTPFAGKTVDLKLLADRGPDGNSEYDLGYYIEPTIVADGAEAQPDGNPTPAFPGYVGPADRTALRNRADQGIMPSNAAEFAATVTAGNHAGAISYQGEDGTLRYVYRPESGALDDIELHLADGRKLYPCVGGGVFFADSTPPVKAELLNFSVAADGIAARWRYTAEAGAQVVGNWRFEPAGKALKISFAAETSGLCWISLGATADARMFRPDGKTVEIPYLYHHPVRLLPGVELFDGRGFDWTVSNGSAQAGNAIQYTPKTDGAPNPIREVAFVAFSPELSEVLPNIPHPVSPWRETAGKRTIFDYWGPRAGNGDEFEQLRRTLELYRRCGLRDLAVLIHVWQQHGYDVKFPDYFPSNPAFGGDAALQKAVAVARDAGWLVALHENYTDSYPDSALFDPALLARNPDGTPVKAWLNQSTGVQSFALKPAESRRLAGRLSGAIQKRFDTDSSYVDVISGMDLGRWCDFDANAPEAGKMHARYAANRETWEALRKIHHGPAFGEGYQVALYAGLNDGCEAEVAGGQDHAVLVDFALLKLHPLQIDQGMGYMVRWLRKNYDTKWGEEEILPRTLDQYRAQTVAYGHTGWLDSTGPYYNNALFVAREYYLVHALQQAYGNANVVAIDYEADGEWISSSVAWQRNRTEHLRIRYDSGLELFVNLGIADWTPMDDTVLGAFGFFGRCDAMTAFQARKTASGMLLDYAEDATGWFVDPRTAEYRLHDGRIPVGENFRKGLNPVGMSVVFPHGVTDVCARLDYDSPERCTLRIFSGGNDWTLEFQPPAGWLEAEFRGPDGNGHWSGSKWRLSGKGSDDVTVFELKKSEGNGEGLR